MKFSKSVFEKLLFPLHPKAYQGIQEGIEQLEKTHPGKLGEILTNFKKQAHSDTGKADWRPGKEHDSKYPERITITVSSIHTSYLSHIS